MTVDDFFLHYLQTGKTLFNFCYSNGMEFFSLGYWYDTYRFFYSLHFSAINLLQLVSNNSKPFKYIGDIYAIGTVRIV